MLGSRAVIGVCAAQERARWSVWDQEAVLVPRNYVDAVQRADGVALVLPPDGELTEHPEEVLELIDGLLLAGGADIDPSTYGAARHPQTGETMPARDAFEVSLARGAIDRDMPVLGICRGMQLINVACGGTLHQHLPEHLGHSEHRRVPGSFEGADHDVEIREGSLAATVTGERLHRTKSHHHQGVDRVGEGLEVSGTSTMDGLPEAIEMPGRDFVLGVQWHPEADHSSPVVAALVARATQRAEAPRQPASRRQAPPRRL